MSAVTSAEITTTVPAENGAGALSQEELRLIHAYWRAANYLSVGQIYLLDSPLLRRPLTLEDIKPRLLGHVWHIVAPSKTHYEHVPEFAKAYSTARVFGGPKVREKLDCVPHMEELTEKPDPAWAGVIDQTCFSGSLLYDEADFYHRASRTLILTDLLFNIPRESDFTTRFWAGLLGVLGKPSRSRSFDVSALERGDVRQSLERMLRWDFDRIILSHGNIVPQHGKEVLRSAFAPYLKGSPAPASAPVTERAR